MAEVHPIQSTHPCLQSLLNAVEMLSSDFAADPNNLLPPLVRAAIQEQNACEDGSEFQELLCSLGWDTEAETFSKSPDPQALASNLKASMLTSLQLVGEGTYSYVYKAKNRLDGTTVMLKRLRADGGEEGLSATAIREMSLLRELTGSPYIVKLLDVLYDYRQRVYLVMEHLDADLHEHLQTNPHLRTEQIIKRYMWQILSGMEYAHAHRVIHRDLKPHNVLVNKKTDSIKIADFGLSRTYHPSAINREYTLEVVTLLYRSPELLLGAKQYTTAVDIWSAGCIFAEMVTGQILFMGDSEIGQLYQIFQLLGTPDETTWPGLTDLPEWQGLFPKWQPQPLAPKVPGLSPLGLELLSSMLQLDPNKRISCKQALAHPYFDDSRNEYVRQRNLQQQNM